MKKRLTQGNCKAISTRINHFTMILLAFVVVIGLLGCSDQEQITLEENELVSEVFIIDGLYEGIATVTEANNSAKGETSDMKLRIEQRENDTMALINEEEEFEIIGTYNDDTGEFHYESGGEVNFIFHLKFKVEGDTITAKGTNTTNQTGQGWTQSVDINLKKTAD